MIKALFAPMLKPNAQALAARELEDAQRSLLDARSASEYATAMVNYHEARVRRLTQYVSQ